MEGLDVYAAEFDKMIDELIASSPVVTSDPLIVDFHTYVSPLPGTEGISPEALDDIEEIFERGLGTFTDQTDDRFCKAKAAFAELCTLPETVESVVLDEDLDLLLDVFQVAIAATEVVDCRLATEMRQMRTRVLDTLKA